MRDSPYMSDGVAVWMPKALGALDDAYNKLLYFFIGFIFFVCSDDE